MWRRGGTTRGGRGRVEGESKGTGNGVPVIPLSRDGGSDDLVA